MRKLPFRMRIFAIITVYCAWFSAVWAHPVSVDGSSADWNLAQPLQDNIGHIARDLAAAGEFVWRDAQADQTGQPSNQNADMRTVGITADDTNLYFIVEMTNIDLQSGDGAPQVQIAIDLDFTEGSGELDFGAEAECQVANRVAWEYLVITRFGSADTPLVLSPGPIPEGTGTAAIAGNFIEISVPWSVLGEIPTAPLHFTVVSLISDELDMAQEQTGADVLDAVTNYGNPANLEPTSAEVNDGTVDYHFQVWFHIDADTEPASPLVFSEVLFDSEESEPYFEWFEIFNQSGVDLLLEGHNVGDEETVGGPEGMRTFPFGSVIAQDDVVTVANTGQAFQAYYDPLVADFEINSSSSIPDLIAPGNWANGPVVLDDTSDELLLVDGFGTIIDLVSWGFASYPGVTAADDIAAGHSLERPMPRDDTDDCGNDMVDKSEPTPGEVAWLLDQGADCTEWVECITDFCVNNVCCDRACDHALCDDYCDGSGVCQIVQCPTPQNGCQLDTCDLTSGCVAAQNTPCDELTCKDDETCDDVGNCIGGTDVICQAPTNDCELASCDANTRCLAAAGSTCDDSDACTVNTSCNASGECLGEAKDCNDDNLCTDDDCDPGSGCIYSNNTDPCDDDDQCSHTDTCSAGSCTGITYTCNDGNGCTDDICDGDGSCSYNNNSEPCDDSDECTHSDTCGGGTCTGTEYDCDDDNPCTTDTCLGDNTCSYTNNTLACDDGNPCTHSDTCGGGTCAGIEYTCDDGNVCTTDACLGDNTCSYTNNSDPCDDGDACTVSDICQGGVCRSGSARDCDDGNSCTSDGCDSATGCSHLNNTANCDDGNVCTEDDICSGGVCAGTEIDCNDSNICTNDSCDPAIGCIFVNNNASCDDQDPCTEPDFCAQGACGGNIKDCDDGNLCTDDDCDGDTGSCNSSYNTLDCDDGNACTADDACASGSCSGASIVCDDNNVCTDDSCDAATGCVFSNNTLGCDDNDACTTDDVCAHGTCAGIALDADLDGYVAQSCGGDDCNDSDANTHPGVYEAAHGETMCSDSIDNDCDGQTDAADVGCDQCTNDADCDDNNVCNGTETCLNALCQAGSSLVCDDSNPCTTDECHAVNGCSNANNSLACDDNDACTSQDICNLGVCVGQHVDCDDSNPCTDQICDSHTGCTYTNNTVSCNDGNLCTTNDVCADGTCVGMQLDCGDLSDQCNTGVCDPALGQCSRIALSNGTPCDDANACTTEDGCFEGSCAGAALNCNDNNPCTDDSCDAETGCIYTNIEAACHDNDACTENDSCAEGLCSGSAIDCSSFDDACQIGSCNSDTGLCEAQLLQDGTTCDDGDPCTLLEVCQTGQCTGTAKDCSDLSDTCNVGLCNTQTGSCQAEAFENGTACDDGDECTSGDNCWDGSCRSGVFVCTHKADSGCGCNAANTHTSTTYLVWLLVGLLWRRGSRRTRTTQPAS